MLAVAMASLLSLFVIFYFVVRAAGLENKTMRPFPIRCLGYNPLACSSEERWVDILQETQNFDFVMLAGTGIRYSGGEPASLRVDDRISISSGFRATNMSNRSCGVSIVLGKNFRNSRVDNICEAGGRIQGRGLAVRVRNPRADFTVCVCVCVCYFPRKPRRKAEFQLYKETCREVVSFLAQVLAKTPSSSTPIVYADVNDGIGITHEAGKWREVESACVSKLAARREHIHGGAGEQIRALLELHFLVSQSSWQDARITYYGNSSDTLIDHIFGPDALLEVTRSSGPLMQMASKLQLIHAKGMPITFQFIGSSCTCLCIRLLKPERRCQCPMSRLRLRM